MSSLTNSLLRELSPQEKKSLVKSICDFVIEEACKTDFSAKKEGEFVSDTRGLIFGVLLEPLSATPLSATPRPHLDCQTRKDSRTTLELCIGTWIGNPNSLTDSYHPVLSHRKLAAKISLKVKESSQ